MKICVTGASGFVGQAVARQLMAYGHEVIGIGRKTCPEGFRGQYFQGDLIHGKILEEALPGCNAVIHTAAKAGYWGNLKPYLEANLTATRNVVHASQHYQVPFIIHTSSASVVFESQPIIKGDESLPLAKHHLSPYTYTKALAEQLILKSHTPGSLETLILRPHLIWGNGDQHLFPRLIDKAKSKSLKQIGSGENWVDMTHVENVAHAHVKALEALIQGRPIGGKAYFITQSEPVPLWPWIKGFLKDLNLPPIRRQIPFRIAYGAGALLEKIYRYLPDTLEPRMTRFLAMQLGLTHTFSSQSAQEAFDYHPIISFAEGMEKSIEYWKKQLQ